MSNYAFLACAFEVKADAEGSDAGSFTGIASPRRRSATGHQPGAFEPIQTKVAPTGELIPNGLMLRDHDRSLVIGGWCTARRCFATVRF